MPEIIEAATGFVVNETILVSEMSYHQAKGGL